MTPPNTLGGGQFLKISEGVDLRITGFSTISLNTFKEGLFFKKKER